MHDPMIGRMLHGTIEIKRLIGKGGMGNVYEGWQQHLERRVAVKVMTPEHARNPMAAEYFIREAKQSSRLRHPNIIQIIDYGKEDDTTLFIAMEFVPGRPLSTILKEEFPLSADRVVDIMVQTLSALEEAHEKTVVHRDLKPDNLMVEETRDGKDFVKVLDFGIAQSKAPGSTAGPLTQAGALVGTPQYMSPEQAEGKSVDARSDLFSMGAILYELLTKKKAFSGKHVPQILMAVIQGEPPSPSAVAAELDIDPKLEAICLRALNKDPALRYQSARDFRTALEQALQTLASAPGPAAPPAQFIFKRTKKKKKRSEPSTKPVAPPDSAPMLKPLDEDIVATIASESGPKTGPTSPGKQPPVAAQRQQKDHSDLASMDTQALHGGLGASESEVVDVSMLFSEAPSTDAPPAIQTDAPEMPREKTAATVATTGIDLEALREDLVGEKFFVTSLVAHQRSHLRMDSETIATNAAVMDEIFAEVAGKWGGVIHSRQGSFTTLVFGLPKMAPDDAFRAAQASLELRQRIRRVLTDDAIGLGFAISQGELFCPGGDVARAAGHVLDSASDLSREVGDWDVMIEGVGLQQQLESTFRLGSPVGRGERGLMGVLDVVRQPRAKVSELIGRDHEMAAALGALGRLGRGNGGMLIVTGEGGMGKSALLASTVGLSEQRGYLPLRARMRYPGHEGVRDMIQQWLRDLGRHYGRSRDFDVLMRELGVETEHARVLDAFVRDRLFEVVQGPKNERAAYGASTPTSDVVRAALRGLLSHLGQERGVVLLLDQVENFTDVLAGFLERWASWFSEHKVLLEVGITVSPGRAFPNFPTSATTIHLDPLDETSCRALLGSRLPQTVSKSVIGRLARLSAGIPSHLDQLVQWAKANPQNLDEAAAEEALSKATNVRNVLQMRLFEQPRNVQNVLALLATLGGEAPGEVVLDLASDEWSVEEVIQKLWVEGLMDIEGEEEEPYLILKPPIFSTIVYEQLSRTARKRAHERIAQYYGERINAVRKDESSRPLRLALVKHLESLGRFDEARGELDRLIDESVRSFDFATATTHIEEAIALATKANEPPAEIASLHLRLVRALESLGRKREASDLCRKIDRIKDLPDRLNWEIRLELTNLWLDEEDPDLIERVVRRVSNELEQALLEHPADIELAGLSIRALQLLGDVYERQGRYSQAAAVLLDAVERTERGNIDVVNNPWGPRLVWEPLNQLGRVRLRKNELPGANQLFELSLKVAMNADDARGEMASRANLSSLFAMQNRLDAAYRSLQTALKLARRSADSRSVAKLEHNRGQLLLRQHRVDLAKTAFEASLALSNALDWREGIAMNAAALARA